MTPGADETHLADGVTGAEKGADDLATVDLVDVDLDRALEQDFAQLCDDDEMILVPKANLRRCSSSLLSRWRPLSFRPSKSLRLVRTRGSSTAGTTWFSSPPSGVRPAFLGLFHCGLNCRENGSAEGENVKLTDVVL